MELFKAKMLAIELLDNHGLLEKGWYFEFDRAKRRFGCCNYGIKRISLSKPLTELRTYEMVRNTILHEIAHALVGSKHNHDNVWKAKAIEIGCNGDRCSSDVRLEPKYIGTCPNGHIHKRHRIPRSRQSCGACLPHKFDERFLITYKKP
jgi:hypothetical protein